MLPPRWKECSLRDPWGCVRLSVYAGDGGVI